MRYSILSLPLVLMALTACDEGTDEPTDTDLPDVVDTTAPTVTISDDRDGTADGDVTFTFTFSEDIGESFTADDVTVDGGTAGAFSATATSASLVVSPPDDAMGTIELSVAAGAFEDLVGNVSADEATAEQDYDTTIPVVETVLMDFEGGEPAGFIGFGGAGGEVVADPTDGSNMVGKIVKADNAELWAGTTMAYCDNDGIAVLDFDAGHTVVTMRVWAPAADLPIRLKAEAALDPTKSVETETNTTVKEGWQTMRFDFTNQVDGTAEINLDQVYDKLSVFPNFGATGADAGEQTFYVDHVAFADANISADCPEIIVPESWPLTFDDDATVYSLTGFGGSEDATVIDDPEGKNGKVAKIVKSDSAELWAGTTISTMANFAVEVVPLTATKTKMTALVWTDKPSIPVRLKLENANDPTKTVETQVLTTKTSEWELLTFDFANEATGTAKLDPSQTFNKMSIFFDFGKTGGDGGGGTYYCDAFDFVD